MVKWKRFHLQGISLIHLAVWQMLPRILQQLTVYTPLTREIERGCCCMSAHIYICSLRCKPELNRVHWSLPAIMHACMRAGRHLCVICTDLLFCRQKMHCVDYTMSSSLTLSTSAKAARVHAAVVKLHAEAQTTPKVVSSSLATTGTELHNTIQATLPIDYKQPS